MEKKEALKLVDELEVSEEKRRWIEQYALNHIESEKNPPQPQKPEEKKDFEYFEVHDTMKSLWKDRNLTKH
jgi:hypothetical protein